MDRNTISGWHKRYQQGGMKALKSKKRGPKKGAMMQLSAEQQKSIRKALIDKNPEQLKLNFALWTREAVGFLIEQESGKDGSVP